MKITDLDERTILIIDSLLNHFSENANSRHFTTGHTWQFLHNQIEGLKSDDIYECFGLIDELLNVGEYKRQKQFFTIDKTKLKIFQSNGGIRKLIEREKSNTEQSDEKSKLEIQNLNLQIQQSKETIKSLRKSNSRYRWGIVIILIGWLIQFVAENRDWSWQTTKKVFQSKEKTETKENKIPALDSLQSNQYKNQQTNDTIE